MRIGLIGALAIFLTASSAWAAQVGNICFATVPIKDKMVIKLIDRKADVHLFFKKADIIRSRYRNYTVESDASDVADQGNRIAAIQFSTYGVASGAGRSDFHEVVKCAFVDTQSGQFLFESDAQMCDGEWKQPKLWQDGSGRYLDFDKLPK
ncbi:hypothetical protein JOS77_09640 [Chromobacterium haemolyticum]|uniref:hypothetical protein n=1 Tax=Chromobacterium amazonense TaxID=1382803 RepID=UPI00193BD9E6|nr:hypothetical protein [Chromobacterium amazonense]MDE1714407.1 hypothetical protein [Chromobacterium amazonense]UGA39676.1 hypothetical protein JOS77_09640 [Chromobacterium haemolyticum]